MATLIQNGSLGRLRKMVRMPGAARSKRRISGMTGRLVHVLGKMEGRVVEADLDELLTCCPWSA